MLGLSAALTLEARYPPGVACCLQRSLSRTEKYKHQRHPGYGVDMKQATIDLADFAAP